MVLTGVKAGDIVLCDVRGFRFYAEVTETKKGSVSVEPIHKGAGYYSATSRQVVAHWRKSKASLA